MGYHIFSFGIKTDKIKSLFGSKDKTILLEISGTDTFKHYENGASSINDNSSLSKALKDIINGENYDEKLDTSYGYAIICICTLMSQKLPYSQELKLGNQTDFMEHYLEENFQIKGLNIEKVLLPDGSNTFDIPKVDFPVIGLILNSELIELQKKFKHISISSENINKLKESENWEKRLAFQHIQGLVQNIDYCVEHDLDMINFCH